MKRNGAELNMNCRIYKNTYCINSDIYANEKKEDFNDYCCNDCLIHIAVEHDKQLENDTILNKGLK